MVKHLEEESVQNEHDDLSEITTSYNNFNFNFNFFRLLIQSTKRNCTRRTAIAEATRYNSPYLHTIA